MAKQRKIQFEEFYFRARKFARRVSREDFMQCWLRKLKEIEEKRYDSDYDEQMYAWTQRIVAESRFEFEFGAE